MQENESTFKKRTWSAHKGDWEDTVADETVCSRQHATLLGTQIIQRIDRFEINLYNMAKIGVCLLICIMLSVFGLYFK